MKPPDLPPIGLEDAAPAHELLVELETRTTTQRLHYRSGDEEGALESVYNLFATTRKLLVTHAKAKAVGVAATFMLNRAIRPYTARWHRWLVDNRFADERARRQFRYELKCELQPQLRRFMELLRLFQTPASQAKAGQVFDDIAGNTPDPERNADLGDAVKAGIGPEVQPRVSCCGKSGPFVPVDEINQSEWRFIRRRREAFAETRGVQPVAKKEPAAEARPAGAGQSVNEAPITNATGLCLSGGGIRSATFCLGIVQVLARQKMLPQFDYLSTVSGGGYLGAFLSSYLGTPEGGLRSGEQSFNGAEMEAAIDKTFKPEGSRESAAVRHLRNNSRYLLNGGLWGRCKVFGLLITGILTNLLLMVPIPLVLTLLVVGLKHFGYWQRNWDSGVFLAPTLALTLLRWPAILLGVVWLLLPVVRNVSRGAAPGSGPARFRNFWEALGIVLGLVTLGFAALALVPTTLEFYTDLRQGRISVWSWVPKVARSEKGWGALTALAPLVAGLLAARLKSGRRKRWMAHLFALSGPLFYIFVFLLVGSRLYHDEWKYWVVLAPTAVALFWGWLAVDINAFSPHGYYRARLCECYLAARRGDPASVLHKAKKWLLHGDGRGSGVSPVETLRQLPLSRLNQTGAAPYHLINTAANLPASHEPNLRGRDCDFFFFSRYYCGGPVCGYVATQELERLDSHVDLGTAMAISGAAASSNMGVKTMRSFRFLLTLLNVRLGYWLRNPSADRRRWFNPPGPLYLFREMTGWMHENSGYVNLSDGGHIENLALYELLRRRCKFIVLVDGGMEPKMECADLMLAQRYAQIDLGVRFTLDLADLALDQERRSRAYGVFGKIEYEPRDKNEPRCTGWLLYLKLACTGGEPGYVVDYRRQNPDFPHQSTGDQLYDEAQFEAYRRLGECAAESLFRGELAGQASNPQDEAGNEGPRFGSLEEWFQALANNLLADNDRAFSARSPSGSP